MFGRKNKNFKLLRDDTYVGPKSLPDLLRDKLFADSTSLWYGADLVYFVPLVKRSSDTNKLIADLTNQASDRYLTIIRKKDVLASVHVCQLVVRKETGVEFKQAWELKVFKAIEFGQEDNELILTFNTSEHVLFFPTVAEKEEASWVLVKVCKLVTGFECSVGFNVDLDAIAYALSQSGSLGRFPVLKQIGVGGATEAFAEEEAEAEALLEERNWTGAGGAPVELQNQLVKEQEELQMEIIDFLLQWEDDEEAKSKAVAAAFGGESAADTTEILVSLQEVDAELERVDIWLGEQIDQLVNIQGKLVMIEAESGSLETSHANLSNLQKMLDLLLTGLHLDKEHEEILSKPEKLFLRAIQSTDFPNDTESILQPAVDALAALRVALSLKGADDGSSIMSSLHWRQLQMLSAVSTQRGKLLDLADRSCTGLSDMFVGLFDRLLTHKALTEGLNSRRTSITVAKFSFGSAIRANVGTADGYRNWSVVSSFENNQAMGAQRVFHDTLADFLPLLEHVMELRSASSVPICNAYVQSVHDKLYRPLVKALFRDLQSILLPRSPVLNMANLPKHSAGGTHEPSIKFMRHSINLQNALLHPWEALEVALCYFVPLVRREEAFFQAVFQLDAEGMGVAPPLVDIVLAASIPGNAPLDAREQQVAPPKSKAEVMLDNLCSYIVQRVEKLANPAQEVDGVETVALLAVLQRFMVEHLQMPISPPSTSVSASAFSSSGAPGGVGEVSVIPGDVERGPKFGHECSPYVAVLMYATRAMLVKRLYAFLSEQLTWLTHQKVDPKKAHVLAPVAKFPSLVLQVVECMGGQQMECVNQVFYRLAKDLFKWVTGVADSNEKYREVVKMHNFGFFEETVGPLNIPFLQKFVSFASQQRKEAEAKYVQWMIAYEFPELSALASRMDGVGARVKPEELALYVRRKDVQHVISLLDAKKVEAGIVSMRGRLEKHCDASEQQGLALRNTLWAVLTERVVGILRRLQEAAFASYQIAMDLSPHVVFDYFEKQRQGK